MNQVRVLICGDRNWGDRAYLYAKLDELHGATPIDVVIEGEARGADTMAHDWAHARGVHVLAFPADWNRYHRAAGPIRNGVMLREGRPDLVVAFHPDLAVSKGTGDMVRQARKAGVPVTVYDGREA